MKRMLYMYLEGDGGGDAVSWAECLLDLRECYYSGLVSLVSLVRRLVGSDEENACVIFRCGRVLVYTIRTVATIRF